MEGQGQKYQRMLDGSDAMNLFYVWIDGKDFNAEEFHDVLDENDLGSVACRKKMSGDEVIKAEKYWKSEEIYFSSSENDAKLLNHVKKLESILLKASDLRIVAQVVMRYCDQENITGYFFSNLFINELSKYNISLDIDYSLEQ